ncbi:hypothetical protein E4P40_25320 [Blastococcus sp. CT_GayMR20]|uniref:hypothetical protein n=1 Tax=Blastococcus sp. CT_GayMR20 TaxID=2559609 RepID=UPI001073B8AB|nr:hypothetical protein [Blastococcus sp. CT_GayMR20]TFV66464.1 hypothetical protein E4P40_25320 [Blastococcus sp. CT_GayMR20]
MSIPGAVRPVLAVALLLGTAACAERTGSPGSASPSSAVALPDGDEGTLVLQAEFTGGFVTPETIPSRLPLASVYADGRVLVEGPVAAIYPGFAWPNVQVLDIGPDGVQALADRALAAGVAETDDLGMPPLADVPSTRFTLVTAEETYVREVYGLTETQGMPDTGLTEQQLAARGELSGLLDELTGLAVSEDGAPVPESWTPAAVAAVVRPWTPSEEDIAQGLTPEPRAWPGPPLPGEPLGPFPDLGCVTASGPEATAVIEAAKAANMLTPWLSADGARWSLLFRPLLPHETSCADLVD